MSVQAKLKTENEELAEAMAESRDRALIDAIDETIRKAQNNDMSWKNTDLVFGSYNPDSLSLQDQAKLLADDVYSRRIFRDFVDHVVNPQEREGLDSVSGEETAAIALVYLEDAIKSEYGSNHSLCEKLLEMYTDKGFER